MFKATTSKFIPRILKNHIQHDEPMLQTLSLRTLRKVNKSTDSSSTDKEDNCIICQKIIDFAFGPSEQENAAQVNKSVSTSMADLESSVKQSSCTQSDKGIDRLETSKPGKDNLGTRKRDTLTEGKLNNCGNKKRVYEEQRGKQIGAILQNYSKKIDEQTDNEEKLVQKMENIEEIPLVPVSSKIGGLFSSLKMVRDRDLLTSNKGNPNYSQSDLSYVLDEIAKKCLNAPLSEIDEHILKEMKRHGFSNSKDTVPIIENNLVQMTVSGISKDCNKDFVIRENRIAKDRANRIAKIEKSKIQNEDIEKLHPSFEVPSYLVTKTLNCDYESLERQFAHVQVYLRGHKSIFGTDDKQEEVPVELLQKQTVENYKEAAIVAIDQKSQMTEQVRNINVFYDNLYSAKATEKDGADNKAAAEDLEEHESIVPPALRESFKADRIKSTREMSATLGPLPKLNAEDKVSLSELLKRVRERNRMEYCKEFGTSYKIQNPVEGKCGDKTPPCPPPAPKCPPPAPKCPPVTPKCPPTPPPCVKPCPPSTPPPSKPSKQYCPPPPPGPCPPKKAPVPCPPKKDPCSKIKKCSHSSTRDTLMLVIPTPAVVNSTRKCDYLFRSKTASTDEVVHEPRICSSWTCTSNLVLARDFKPWSPIPSWPYIKKEIKRPLVCPKEGCKDITPRRLIEKKIDNPCVGFPKRQNFSATENLYL